MSKKVAVILSGCGYLDGAEIQETVYTMLALDQSGAEVSFFAPNEDQMHVVDHTKAEPVVGEKRNVLKEAARIVRGKISDVKSADASNFDALIFPGGFGAAKNLSDFAVNGPDCKVNASVEKLIKDFYSSGKPIGFICIAPALAAKVIGDGVKLTIGTDEGTASALESLGAKHVNCKVEEACIDEDKKVASAPAFMYDTGPSAGVFAGIQKVVQAVLKMA